MKKFIWLFLGLFCLLGACSEDVEPSLEEGFMGAWTLVRITTDCGPSIDCIPLLNPTSGQYNWMFQIEENKLIVENIVPDAQGVPLLASNTYDIKVIAGKNEIVINSVTYRYLLADNEIILAFDAPEGTSPINEYIFFFDRVTSIL